MNTRADEQLLNDTIMGEMYEAATPGPLISELNTENEIVRESNDTEKKMESFADIFTKRAGVMQMANDGEKLRDSFMAQLAKVTQVAVESEISEDMEKYIYGAYKQAGIPAHDYTDEQLDKLFAGIKFTDGIETKCGKDGMSFHDFLREYLVLFITTEESIDMTNKAMQEIDKANKDYINEVDALISSLDSYEHMNNLLARAENESDPIKKEMYFQEWKSMYAASDLSYVLDKLNNKPRKVLLKEMKQYDAVKKKAFNVLKNDPKNQFMDIRSLEEVLIEVYGKELSEQIRITLFLLYKKINKRNTVEDPRLVAFTNLFTLNAYKLVKYNVQEKASSVFYNKLKEALETI